MRKTVKLDVLIDDEVEQEAARLGMEPHKLIESWANLGQRVWLAMRARGGGVWVREREGAELERLVTWLPTLVEMPTEPVEGS